MDRTAIQVGHEARDRLADYRDANDHPNYHEALVAAVDEAEAGEGE